MSTNARVGMVLPDGTVRSIYTHWDGMPDHHGPILAKHFDTPEKVEALLDLGDLSILAEEIGEQHSFDTGYRDQPTWCVAYARDRGEDGVDAVTHDADAWPEYGQAYEYMMDGDGVWFARKVGAEWEAIS